MRVQVKLNHPCCWGYHRSFPCFFNNIEMNYIINNLICIFQNISEYNIIYFVEVFFKSMFGCCALHSVELEPDNVVSGCLIVGKAKMLLISEEMHYVRLCICS